WWERYPYVIRSEPARVWLQMQHDLQLAPKTLDAYGRSLNDYFAFCDRHATDPETVTRAYLARYVADLTTRPCPARSGNQLDHARRGLANATIQLRLTVVRLFYDHLIEHGVREDNPVGRGRYTPGNAFAGKRERGLLARYQRLPWIPGDDQWQALLRAVRDEPLRNRAMFVLAYDGALRREELVTVQIGDLDFAHRHVRLRAERTKNGVARVVTFSQTTGALLVAYQRQRATLSRVPGVLFLSESRRNRAQPLSASMWSKVVTGIAGRAGCPLFTTHTLRHLRLTHMARAGLDLHLIATYAGHRSVQTTLRYIHLSGVELAEKMTRTMAGIDRMVAEALQ
ncbi:MAG: tyrosine-type recombinase/integrase, partial [Chloroflexota bacterium]|nr:tyrosine-type recombinase/integrase [Chloroflexota bacterium]